MNVIFQAKRKSTSGSVPRHRCRVLTTIVVYRGNVRVGRGMVRGCLLCESRVRVPNSSGLCSLPRGGGKGGSISRSTDVRREPGML